MAGSSRSVDEPPPMPPDRRFDMDGDATRRTWLASERTVLAWLRTGLTATAVALAVGKVIPDLRNATTTWPYAVIGAGYAMLGVLIVAYGMYRGREVDRAIRAGRWIGPQVGAMAVLGVAAIGLGAAATVLVFSGA